MGVAVGDAQYGRLATNRPNELPKSFKAAK